MSGFETQAQMRAVLNPLTPLLNDHSLLILDGGLATELERRGGDLRHPLWSAQVLLDKPQLIAQAHHDYLQAGADCIISASYQATIPGFLRYGLTAAASERTLKDAVRLAVETRDAFWNHEANRIGRPRPLVAASVGPYGAFLADGSEYRGDYLLNEVELMAFHRPRLAALLSAGPDLLACETLPSRAEARALARLLAEFPEACAFFSFSARNEAQISDGERLADCAAELDDLAQVVAIGVNCSAPQYIPALIAAARTATCKPIVVYPNSGETWDAAQRRWCGPATVDAFAREAQGWYEAGARLIGGCCRTTPAHIAQIAALLRP